MLPSHLSFTAYVTSPLASLIPFFDFKIHLIFWNNPKIGFPGSSPFDWCQICGKIPLQIGRIRPFSKDVNNLRGGWMVLVQPIWGPQNLLWNYFFTIFQLKWMLGIPLDIAFQIFSKSVKSPSSCAPSNGRTVSNPHFCNHFVPYFLHFPTSIFAHFRLIL